MRVICSKSGTRDNCSKCAHNEPHDYHPLNGCDCGACYPPMPDDTGMMRNQNYPCVEYSISESVNTSGEEVEI